jgi:hypothetical protein
VKGERPLEIYTLIWEDNIKTDLEEVTWAGMDRIDLAQGRDRWLGLANAVMYFLFNLLIPSGFFSYLQA